MKFWDNLTYQQKAYVSLTLGLIGLVMCYNLAFSKTLDISASNETMEEKLQNANSLPRQIKKMKQSLEYLNTHFGNYIEDDTKDREALLHLISSYCHLNNITLISYPYLGKEKKNDINIHTNQVIARGNFIDLLRLLYHLEKEEEQGRIVSSRFSMSRDFTVNKYFLELTISIQTVEIDEKEKL